MYLKHDMLFFQKHSIFLQKKHMFFKDEKAKQKVLLENCKCFFKKKMQKCKSVFLLGGVLPATLAMGLEDKK